MNYYAVEKTTGKVKGIKSTPFVENFKCYAYESDLIFDIGDIFNPLGNEISRANRRKKILEQIKDHYEKIPRAVYEPGVKDETTGQTWLEYRNAEIATLRAEYNSLGVL